MSSKKTMMRSEDEEIIIFGKEKFAEAAFQSWNNDAVGVETSHVDKPKLRFEGMQSLWVIGSDPTEDEVEFKTFLDESSLYYFSKYEDLACAALTTTKKAVPENRVDLCLIQLPILTSFAGKYRMMP